MVPDLKGYTVLEATMLAMELGKWKVRDGNQVIEDPNRVITGQTGAQPGDCLDTGELLGVILDPTITRVRSPFLLGALGGLVGGLVVAVVLLFLKAIG